MISSIDVAKYFLAQSDVEDAGDTISNLKLQKLLYYAQGFHIALYNAPLFNAPIMAWTHGPVVPEVYHAYKGHGAGAIPPPDDMDFDLYDEETRGLLDEVYRVYGQFSAWKLRNMTHEEPPWKEAAPDSSEITLESMKAYFDTLVDHG